MAQSGIISDSVNSKTFWYCLEDGIWPDAIDIISIILESTAIILNIFTGCLLLRIKEGDRVSIVLLRNFIFNNIVDAIMKLFDNVVQFPADYTNVELNYAICFIFDSRFLYWLFNTFAIEALTLFAIDRVISLKKMDSHLLMSTETRLKWYLATIYCFGIAITAPQFISVNLENGGCTCAPTHINVLVLSIIYAHVFLRFFLLVLLNGGIQLLCAAAVIKWIRQTPVHNQYDELNHLHLVKKHSDEALYLKHLEERTSWRTPSLCILPLSIFYVITFGFDATYQFFSGASVTTYVIGGPVQKAGTMLLVVFSNIAPIILFIYLPVLRLSLAHLFHELKGRQSRSQAGISALY